MQFYVNDEKVFAPSAEIRSKLAATLVNLRTIYTECLERFVDNGHYAVQVVSQTHTASINKNSTHIVSVKKNLALYGQGTSVMLRMNDETCLRAAKTRMIDECAQMLDGEVVIRVWQVDKNGQLQVYKPQHVSEHHKVNFVVDEALIKKARRYYESEKKAQSLTQFCAAALKVPTQLPKYQPANGEPKPTGVVTYSLPKGADTYIQAEYDPELHDAAMRIVPPKVDLLVGIIDGVFGVYEPTFTSIVPELARVDVLWIEHTSHKHCYVQAGNSPATVFDLERWNEMVSAMKILVDDMHNIRMPLWLSPGSMSILNDFANRGDSIVLLCSDDDKINAVLDDFREAFPKHANFSTDVFALCDLDEIDYVRARERGSVIVTDGSRYKDMPGVVHTPKFFAALRNVKKR